MSSIMVSSLLWFLIVLIGFSHAASQASWSHGGGGGNKPTTTAGWESPQYTSFFEYELPIPPVKEAKLTYYPDDPSEPAIDYYEIELKSFEKQIYPDGPPTTLIGYDEAVVRWINNSPLEMTVHVHGQYNRAPFDGWAANLADPGQYKDDYYPNEQSARTMWYHAHTQYQTAAQVYQGQAGFYMLTDAAEDALGLPSGEYDIPLMLASIYVDYAVNLNYSTNNSFGLFGDVNVVNGQPWPYLEVEPRKYRFRILDAAVSRTYELSLSDDQGGSVPFDVIASDSGLFSAPVTSENIYISPGERYEIIIDFADYTNKNITMNNAPGVGDVVDYAASGLIMRFVVCDSVDDDSNNNVPSKLVDVPDIPDTDQVDKDFTFALNGPGGQWTVNGVGWADIENRIIAKPTRGKVEKWRLRNGYGGGTHPVHIHLVDFQVINRTGGVRHTTYPYETAGLKDVVWLDYGEVVDVVARYAPWDGVYMFHCHDLVHEDRDMMVAFNVTQLAKWGYTNDTIFVDPMQTEFRPLDIDPADFTEEAIMQKLAWFASTGAYNHGDIEGVYSALDAAPTGKPGFGAS